MRIPIPKHRSPLALLGLCAPLCLVTVASCTSEVGTLTVTLVRSPDLNEEPLEGIAAFVRLRVDGPDGLVGPKTFPIGAGTGSLGDIPTGEGQVLTVEGVGPEGTGAVSVGRTGPLTIEEGENSITLFIGRVEQFSRTPQSASGGAEDALIARRAFHRATAYGRNQVLLTGGLDDGDWRPGQALAPPPALTQAERLDGNSLRFAAVDCTRGACPRHARLGHSATRLPSGNVLIAGGISGGASSGAVAEVEVFDAETRSFFAGAKLRQPRRDHGAVRQNGSVAVVGGSLGTTSQVTGAVEDYKDGQLDDLPQLNTPRRNFSLLRLADGTLFVSGGFDAQGKPLSSTEQLKPGGSSWKKDPKLQLTVARGFHSATLLSSGDVLLIGGLGASGQATGVIERYSPDEQTIKAEEQLNTERWGHTASLLRDGRVLVVGGFGGGVAGEPTREVDVISFTSTGALQDPKQPFRLREPRGGHAATVLPSGFLLITGGVTVDCSSAPCVKRASGSAEVFVY